MGPNPLVMMGASKPARIRRSKQVPQVRRKVELRRKGGFYGCLLSTRQRPPYLSLARTLERNQKLVLVGSANHTEGVLLSVSVGLQTAFCHVNFWWSRVCEGIGSLWNCQLTKQSSPLQWPLLQEDTCGWCWKHHRDPSRVGVKVSCLSGVVKDPSIELSLTILCRTVEAGLHCWI
ncbi:hypothetical protein DER44DRAFT_456068 [Fusarium oxysporum]|nr:hypothetical protein DER44DRAFT_456068 [Fusarium oxysporum]